MKLYLKFFEYLKKIKVKLGELNRYALGYAINPRHVCVVFDEEQVKITARSESQEILNEEMFLWRDIVRVGYHSGGLSGSDLIFVFLKAGQEVVLERNDDGGPEFWKEILQRNLMPMDVAVQVLEDGATVFWPPLEEAK